MKLYSNFILKKSLTIMLSLFIVFNIYSDLVFSKNLNNDKVKKGITEINIEFTTDVGVRFLKRVSDAILNKGNNYVDETKFNTNLNNCIKSFETNEVPALKQFYDKAKHLKEDVEKWDKLIFTDTIVQALYSETFMNDNKQQSCGHYIEKAIKEVPDKAKLKVILSQEFGGFNTINNDHKMVTSMYHQHRGSLYPGGFKDINSVSRGGSSGKKMYNPNTDIVKSLIN